MKSDGSRHMLGCMGLLWIRIKVLFKYYNLKPSDLIFFWMYSPLQYGILSSRFNIRDYEYDGYSDTRNSLKNLKRQVDGRHLANLVLEIQHLLSEIMRPEWSVCT